MNKLDILEELLNVGVALSSVRELDTLLDIILSEAQRLTNADGASIYLVEGNKLVFKLARSNTLFKKLGEENVKKIFRTYEIPLTKESIAGYVVITKKTVNIQNVEKIKKNKEYKYNDNFDRKYGYKTISLLTFPLIDKNNLVIGAMQLVNSMDAHGRIRAFNKLHEKITSSLSSQAAVAIINAKLTEELNNAHMDTVFRLSTAAEYRDKETSNHIKRVSYYSKIIAENMGFSKEESNMICQAAPMHDIGKLGIPDSILQKPGILTPEERIIMEKHTIIGALILKDSPAPLLIKSRIIALTHHEKYDGTGYPKHLKGENIPIEGRIVAIADVYDALSTKRCYKNAFSEQQVKKILHENKGTHFDPAVLNVFFKHYEDIKDVKNTYADKEVDFNKYHNLNNIKFI